MPTAENRTAAVVYASILVDDKSPYRKLTHRVTERLERVQS